MFSMFNNDFYSLSTIIRKEIQASSLNENLSQNMGFIVQSRNKKSPNNGMVSLSYSLI